MLSYFNLEKQETIFEPVNDIHTGILSGYFSLIRAASACLLSAIWGKIKRSKLKCTKLKIHNSTIREAIVTRKTMQYSHGNSNKFLNNEITNHTQKKRDWVINWFPFIKIQMRDKNWEFHKTLSNLALYNRSLWSDPKY